MAQRERKLGGKIGLVGTEKLLQDKIGEKVKLHITFRSLSDPVRQRAARGYYDRGPCQTQSWTTHVPYRKEQRRQKQMLQTRGSECRGKGKH